MLYTLAYLHSPANKYGIAAFVTLCIIITPYAVTHHVLLNLNLKFSYVIKC